MPNDTSSTDQSVIRRKTRAAYSSAGAGGTAVTRLWHMVLPRVADEMMGLQAAVRAVTEAREPPAAFCSRIPEDALILLLAGPDLRQGLAIVDAGLLAALTEVQMTGHVSPAPPVERRPTPTDAAISGGVIDAWMAVFEAGLEDLGEPHGIAGLRQSATLSGARAAEMALGPAELSVTTLVLDLGSGAKQGSLTIATPPPARPGEAQITGRLGERLRPVLMESEAELKAVLHRTFLPYGRISTLTSGDTIDLPREAIGAVSLETVDERPVATGRLGQAGGVRAVRISLAEEDAAAPPDLVPLTAAAAGSEDPPGLPPLPELPDLPPAGDLPSLDLGTDGVEGIGDADTTMPDGDPGVLPPLPDLPGIGEQGEAPEPTGELSDLPELPDLPIAAPPLPGEEEPV